MQQMIHQNIDISARDLLQKELHRRCQANPQYSLRSFAKALGISSTVLSLVLTGKRQASKNVVHALAELLGLDPQTETFKASNKISYYENGRVQSGTLKKTSIYQGISLLEGHHASYYPDGKIKDAWVGQNQRVQNVLLTDNSHLALFSNGQIESAHSAEDIVVDGAMVNAKDSYTVNSQNQLVYHSGGRIYRCGGVTIIFNYNPESYTYNIDEELSEMIRQNLPCENFGGRNFRFLLSRPVFYQETKIDGFIEFHDGKLTAFDSSYPYLIGDGINLSNLNLYPTGELMGGQVSSIGQIEGHTPALNSTIVFHPNGRLKEITFAYSGVLPNWRMPPSYATQDRIIQAGHRASFDENGILVQWWGD